MSKSKRITGMLTALLSGFIGAAMLTTILYSGASSLVGGAARLESIFSGGPPSGPTLIEGVAVVLGLALGSGLGLGGWMFAVVRSGWLTADEAHSIITENRK